MSEVNQGQTDKLTQLSRAIVGQRPQLLDPLITSGVTEAVLSKDGGHIRLREAAALHGVEFCQNEQGDIFLSPEGQEILRLIGPERFGSMAIALSSFVAKSYELRAHIYSSCNMPKTPVNEGMPLRVDFDGGMIKYLGCGGQSAAFLLTFNTAATEINLVAKIPVVVFGVASRGLETSYLSEMMRRVVITHGLSENSRWTSIAPAVSINPILFCTPVFSVEPYISGDPVSSDSLSAADKAVTLLDRWIHDQSPMPTDGVTISDPLFYNVCADVRTPLDLLANRLSRRQGIKLGATTRNWLEYRVDGVKKIVCIDPFGRLREGWDGNIHQDLRFTEPIIKKTDSIHTDRTDLI